MDVLSCRDFSPAQRPRQARWSEMKIVVVYIVGAALALSPIPRAQAGHSADGAVVGAPATATDVTSEAWTLLQDSLQSKRVDTRIAGLSALSLLGGNDRAEQLVRGEMKDDAADIDVRLAAIVAAGQMDGDRGPRSTFRNDLRTLLQSNDPKLSFTAASTLWALHDPSGEEVLTATAEGERASDYSFLKRSEHNASRTLHSPEALAKIAVMQSLTIFVPPVGMGMGAYGYLKGTPGASPQVTAIEQLAKVHNPAVQAALVEATKTKDAGARIAAAEALSKFPAPPVRDALQALISDDKLQVRLTASAAYLAVTGHGTRSRH